MPATRLLIVAGALALGLLVYLRQSPREAVFEPKLHEVEQQSPCAWNDAEVDLTNWFAGATGYIAQDVILSGQRLPLEKKIGHPLRPDEMLLHSYVVRSNEAVLGTVLPRRFKGEHGAIEFVVALDADRRIRHLKIQRAREPAEVVAALSRLERDFENKSAADDFAISAQSSAPAENLAHELKSLLALYDAGAAETRIAGHH